jgi:hypothetical protein
MLTSKFVRAHFVNTSQTATNAMRWTFKLIYEFWGFCVNGGSDLKVPGGFASSGSIPVLSGAVIFPAGFESGSTVLLASGTDGFTADGMPFFNTVDNIFSASYVGKHIVTWKSGSVSTDDSIYQITQWLNSSSVRVNVNQGATPYTASLHPSFTARSNINYRVIDFNAAANLSGFTTNDGLVLQFNGASLINTGQLNSQCRLRHNTTNMGLRVSPSGSWLPISGAFLDPSSETNVNWANSGTGTGYISLWGAQDYLIAHSRGSWNTAGSWLHVEIPARLYPQPLDPNVIIFVNYAADQVDQTNYYNMSMMSPIDGVTRSWEMYIRNPIGGRWNITQFSSPYTLRTFTNGRWNNMFFNVFTNKFIFMDGILGLTSVTTQYSLARVRVRRLRFTVPIIPTMQRIGDLGEWLHIQDGVLWPWDNALLPYSLFLGGQ